MEPRPPVGVEAELDTDLGAGAVAAGLGAAVPGTEEQPTIKAPPANMALARTVRSCQGPASAVRQENLRAWLLISPSLTAAAVRWLRQST
jgi:hypothetical protein